MAAHARAAIRHLAQEAERPPAERFYAGESLLEFKQVEPASCVYSFLPCREVS